MSKTNVASTKVDNETAMFHKKKLIECIEGILMMGTSELVKSLNDALYSHIQYCHKEKLYKEYTEKSILNIQSIINFIVQLKDDFESAKHWNPDLKKEFYKELKAN